MRHALNFMKMTSIHHDLWLCAFLGVFGFLATRAIHTQLEAMRKVTEIAQDQGSKSDEEPRNDLDVKTLGELTRCPNPDIQFLATKFVAYQTFNSPSYDLLIECLASQNPSRRDKALICLHFLISHRDDLPIDPYKTFKALFECMRNLHAQFHAFETSFRDTPETSAADSKRYFPNRKGSIFSAIIVLAVLLQHDNRCALRAGFAEWLVSYPFGGDCPTEWKKKLIVDITTGYYEDPTMYIIITFAIANDEVRAKLLKHGLVDNVKGVIGRCEDGSDFAWCIGSDGTVESILNASLRNAARSREESIEERALRRRRREAMVLGETGRPIERGDIIERRNTDEGDEEVGREPRGAADEVQFVDNARQWAWWDLEDWRRRNFS